MVIQPQKNLLENPLGDPLSLNDMTPQWPVKSFKSYGEFGAGDKRHGGKHDGIDLGAEKGTPVYTMLPGIVKKTWKESKPWVEGDPKQGNAITISHPDFGIETFYAHLNSVSVSVGEKVNNNSIIGTVGNSGNARSTKPHIHFETRQNGSPTNPRSIMGKSLDDLMLNTKQNKKLSLAIDKIAQENVTFDKKIYLTSIKDIETILLGFDDIIKSVSRYKPKLKSESISYNNESMNKLYQHILKWNKFILHDLLQIKKMFPQNIIIDNIFNLIEEKSKSINYVYEANKKYLTKSLLDPDTYFDFSFDKRNSYAINAIISIKEKLNSFINEMNAFVETIHGTNEFDEFDKRLKKMPKNIKREARINFLKILSK